MPVIKIKRGSGEPSSIDAGELAFDTTNGVLFCGLQVGAFTTPFAVNRQSPLHGYWEFPEAKDYPLCLKTDRKETSLRIFAKTDSGSCKIRMKAGTTDLGSAALTVASSSVVDQHVTGLSLNSGTTLYLTVSQPSDLKGLAWSLHFGV